MAEGHSRPFIHDLARTQIGVPGDAAESVKVRHGKVITEPILVESYVCHCNQATRRSVECLARNDLFHRSVAVIRMQVGIKHLFPHRKEKTELALLTRVLLGYLKLERFVCLL